MPCKKKAVFTIISWYTVNPRAGGDSSGLDANYLPPLTVGQRPSKGGGGF